MNIIKKLFHKHTMESELEKYTIEYQHILDNGKVGKCPYKDCTKKYRTIFCRCGKSDKMEWTF